MKLRSGVWATASTEKWQQHDGLFCRLTGVCRRWVRRCLYSFESVGSAVVGVGNPREAFAVTWSSGALLEVISHTQGHVSEGYSAT